MKSDEEERPWTEQVEELLGMGPIPGDTPVAEVMCWLNAKIEDERSKHAQEQRRAGELPLEDCELFMHVMRPFGVSERFNDRVLQCGPPFGRRLLDLRVKFFRQSEYGLLHFQRHQKYFK
jgi:hypothetical protein